MKLVKTPLAGVMVVEIEPARDERGYFLQTYSDELHELLPQIAEGAVSWNETRGTLRGLHFQHAPHGEAKIVRCSRGAIYDVALDLEPDDGLPSSFRGTISGCSSFPLDWRTGT